MDFGTDDILTWAAWKFMHNRDTAEEASEMDIVHIQSHKLTIKRPTYMDIKAQMKSKRQFLL